MKIGIMTFHAASNHGAALQAYALQTQLQKMGHEPFFINYRHGAPPSKGLLGWIGSTPGKTMHKIGVKLKGKPFSDFQKNHLIIGKERYSDHIQLKNNPPIADAYICGSDQIWSPIQIALKKDEHAYWLDFGGPDVRRIAYAASLGVFDLSSQIMERYASYAKYFDAISVREKNAVNIVNRLSSTNPAWVPDPTLLLDQIEYPIVETKNTNKVKPFLFSCQIEAEKRPLDMAAQINKCLCTELNLRLYESLSISFLYNMFHRRYLGPNEWLGMLRQSTFVFTNSFHATVFSLLFHRPFVVLLRTGALAGANSRIESLLELVGLQRRAVLDFDRRRIEELCLEEIDWDEVDLKIQKFRIVGQQFLANCLK